MGVTPLTTTPTQLEEARITISQTRGSHSPGRLLPGSAAGASIITSQMTGSCGTGGRVQSPGQTHHKHSKSIQQNRGNDERQTVTEAALRVQEEVG